MRSTEGKHFEGLDHLRALAAFMVVMWHFAHRPDGTPVPFGTAPAIGLLDEGHAGVALFMTLSGYLFARLIGDRKVHYPTFLWNRALRLLPMLLLFFLITGLRERRSDPLAYLGELISGFVLPTWPHDGWSIAAEIHFYLLLPPLLWGLARWRWLPLALIGVTLALRTAMLGLDMPVQAYSYYTLVGRIDQFLFGMLFAYIAVSGRWVAAAMVGLWAVYAAFTAAGGFYAMLPPWIWVVLPTVDGLAFAALVSWYDRRPWRGRGSRTIAAAGTYSYSIYLLHGFVVYAYADAIERYVMDMNTMWEALPFGLIFFVYMVALGRISYRLLEAPFLKLRRPYLDLEPRSSAGARPDPIPQN